VLNRSIQLPSPCGAGLVSRSPVLIAVDQGGDPFPSTYTKSTNRIVVRDTVPDDTSFVAGFHASKSPALEAPGWRETKD
jgi:hypothetical protein